MPKIDHFDPEVQLKAKEVNTMGATKTLLKTGATAIELTRANRCYMVSDSGEEVRVTKEMIQMACHQLLSRCRK